MSPQNTAFSPLDLSSLHLTPMQQATGEAVQAEGICRVLSPTGSGKTLAFLLPLMRQPMLRPAVVVCPSRELCLQSRDVWRSMPDAAASVCLYGGRAAMEEHRRLKEVRPEVVFATPGRLLDHVAKQNLAPATFRTLVFDEFDKCFEMGFRDEIQRVLSAFSHVRRVWLFSATETDEARLVTEQLATERKCAVQRLDFSAGAEDSFSRVDIYMVSSPVRDKLTTLSHTLMHTSGRQTIVFVAYRESVERVVAHLQGDGFAVEAYHGGLDQEQRERALFRFRAGAVSVLVSTDLGARGLDIPEVEAVVHYHLPKDVETFAHRSGRTARWTAGGSTYLLVGPDEACPDFIQEPVALDVFSQPVRPVRPAWTCLYLGRGKRDKISKGDVVGFLCKKGGLTQADVGRIEVHATHCYAAVRASRVKALLAQTAGEKIKNQRTLLEVMRTASPRPFARHSRGV